VDREPLILAIDQGTTNTKALLVDRTGAIRARASRPLSIAFPQPGWVEQDARALWWSVLEAIHDCLAQAGEPPLTALGIANQRESVVMWDRQSGEPLGPCIVWQCRRTVDQCNELRARGFETLIRKRSGLTLDPLFSATKMAWLLESIPDGHARAAAGQVCTGTVDSWLLWNLSGGAQHATDSSNASRTQLLNLNRCAWDRELLTLFNIPEACLPQVRPSTGVFSHTAQHGSLPAGIPIASLIGDSHAALFGHAAFFPGSVKATYGTGSSLMTRVESPVLSTRGLSTTVAWSEPTGVRYAMEGNITNTGGAVQWLGEFLSFPGGASDVAALAATVPDAGSVYLVPAFAGLGAPHWDANARGVLCGLTRGATAAHAARATVESIAYQIRDVFEAIRQDTALAAPALFADGGASANSQLMQFQADILGCPVIRSASSDLSAIGAAWLAGLATGFWASLEELESLPRATERFEPQMPESRREELLDGWRDALRRAASASATVSIG
jgi:glycerol kinase